MLTNVDDIETYMMTINNVEYLKAIDIPVKERGNVMRELRYMGITACPCSKVDSVVGSVCR